MEPLSFLRPWRAITSVSKEISNEEDDEDSFFELEFTIPDTTPTKPDTLCSNKKQSSFFHSNHGEFFSKRKILPMESPTSPISRHKSAPRFRVFMFRKNKTVPTIIRKTGKTEHVGSRGSSSFTVKLKMKDFEPNLARDLNPKSSEDSCMSKRFAMDVIRKYLMLVKVKVSRKQSSKVKLVDEQLSVSSSPASRESYRKSLAGFRVVGKRKSAATAAGLVSPARRDDSLIQHDDGIQSAILHCKRSFSSSRDFGMLSRSATVHDNVFELARHSVEQTSRASVSF